jgi:hypothetical protein
MDGLVVGAVLGMGFVAFYGGVRSIRNYRESPARGKRAAAALVYALACVQFALGLACLAFGLWFLVLGI